MKIDISTERRLQIVEATSFKPHKADLCLYAKKSRSTSPQPFRLYHRGGGNRGPRIDPMATPVNKVYTVGC